MGPSARTGKNVSPTTMTTTPVSRPTNSGVCVGNVPAVGGHRLLAAERAGDREHRDHQEEPADEHRDAQRRVEPVRVPVRPANAEPLLFAGEVNA